MKLNEFIKSLQDISNTVPEPHETEVQMADCISVVKPVLLDNTVFITDIDPDTTSD